jgi:ATP-dependent DNA helicase RecG
MQRKQEKARQKEAILRYLDDIDEITNEDARRLLKLADKDISTVSRLFAELKEAGLIQIADETRHNQRIYKRVIT